VLERTILFSKGDRIERAELQLASGGAAHPPTSPPPIAAEPARMSPGDSQPLQPIDEDEDGEVSGSLKDAVRAETARVERELIVKALDETGGNVTQAARLLKISRKSLQMKMKELGLRDRESGN